MYKLEKPCPFCGRTGTLFVEKLEEYDAYYVNCAQSDNGCMACGPLGYTEEEAIDLWNERATETLDSHWEWTKNGWREKE